MKVDIQKLVEMITAEVITQLTKMGVEIEYSSGTKITNSSINKNHSKVIEMNGYITPVLTENQLTILDGNIIEIIIPRGTIITPGAREIIKKRQLVVSHIK